MTSFKQQDVSNFYIYMEKLKNIFQINVYTINYKIYYKIWDFSDVGS